MTRTEYFLDGLVWNCNHLAALGVEARTGEKDVSYEIAEKVTNLTALIELLNEEKLFADQKDKDFEDTVRLRVKVFEANYQFHEARTKRNEKTYQLKESPLTDLPKFHSELKEHFPEIAKRKALRVYESEKTEPFMDLMHAHAMVLQEVKT